MVFQSANLPLWSYFIGKVGETGETNAMCKYTAAL